MHKVTNLSTIRQAARMACKTKGMSIKDNVEVIICGFKGTVNDHPASLPSWIYNHGHKWYYGQELIRTIEGTYTDILIID